MNSYLQTVDMTIPSSELSFQTLEYSPVPPLDLWREIQSYKKPLGLKTETAYIYWFPDGRTEVRSMDGTFKVFYPPVTLKDALQYRDSGFFQFHKDNTVTCRSFGHTYYWSAPIQMPPITEMTDENRLYPKHQRVGPLVYEWEFDYDDRDLVYSDVYENRAYKEKEDSDYESDSSSYTYYTYDSRGRRESYRGYRH
jgi:hypothetical protein